MGEPGNEAKIIAEKKSLPHLCFWDDMVGLQLNGEGYTQLRGEGPHWREGPRRQHNGTGTCQLRESLQKDWE